MASISSKCNALSDVNTKTQWNGPEILSNVKIEAGITLSERSWKTVIDDVVQADEYLQE
jgi:hypothetical protein